MFDFASLMGGTSATGQGGFAGLGIGNPGSHGGAFATGAPSPGGDTGGVGGLFADPNFINFLAGTGAALDPEGVGGALGKPVQAWNQNKQMGKAMEKQDQRWGSLMEAMAGGKVGKATLKEDGKGGSTVTLGAPEGGLGTLNQQPATQPAVDPFQQWMSQMQSFQQTYLK